MPKPMPMMNEGHDEFMNRCMKNGEMDEDSCQMQWDQSKKSASGKIERRSFDITLGIEARADKPEMIVGHAAVFNRIGEGGWFREQVMPGAFRQSITEDDVRALFNHDANFVLGRNRAGTLRMSEDDVGLAIEIDPPDTQFANDLKISISRGDISQMSFGFEVIKDSWERGEGKDLDLRTLETVKLWDVSPVTFPFYRDTDVAVRSYENWKETFAIPSRTGLLRKITNFKDKRRRL